MHNIQSSVFLTTQGLDAIAVDTGQEGGHTAQVPSLSQKQSIHTQNHQLAYESLWISAWTEGGFSTPKERLLYITESSIPCFKYK